MVITNFFSDVLLSLLHLFEDYLFDNKSYFYRNTVQDSKPHNFFKSVQFNIGNRNFQIGSYKEAAQLEFPTGIFTFVNDETAWGKMGNLIGHHRIWDVNEITCTHNKDTDVDIMLREEQAMLYMMVQINCASMAQANEVVHQIKRFLPPQKFCQIFPFESFVQIPPEFFHNDLNNPDIHDIENLYLRYDGTTGEKNYFYRSFFKPHVQLNSVSADLADNSARSYPVTCDFSYLIQLPMWLFDTYNEKHVERINLGMQSSDNISSVIVDNSFLSVNNRPLEINGVYYIAKEQYIIDETSENYKNNRIVIPMPVSLEPNGSNSAAGKDNFIISIAKLYPRESTVVSWIGARPVKTSILGNERKSSYNDYIFNTLKTNYLSDKDYVQSENQITIFTDDKKDLTPDLTSPVIITILQPKQEEDIDKALEPKNYLKTKIPKVFVIKDNKNRLRI